MTGREESGGAEGESSAHTEGKNPHPDGETGEPEAPLAPRLQLLAYFHAVAKATIAKMDIASSFQHKTVIGNEREAVASQLLRTLLPSSLDIETGEVVSSEGKRSKQEDLILVSGDSVRFGTDGGTTLCPSHSAIATIEVKSSFDAAARTASIEHSRRIKDLCPFTTSPWTAKTTFEPAKGPEDVSLPKTPYYVIAKSMPENAFTQLGVAARQGDVDMFPDAILSLEDNLCMFKNNGWLHKAVGKDAKKLPYHSNATMGLTELGTGLAFFLDHIARAAQSFMKNAPVTPLWNYIDKAPTTPPT